MIAIDYVVIYAGAAATTCPCLAGSSAAAEPVIIVEVIK